ncbi:Sulfotransferase domain protein [Tritonibacter multivorans]|uniref:Sulfotransferase domain protein n=1 Tax=Tritonibacter multivorans TaxID=928856 RepID=A0A0P1G811_9RHOB|nr:sulfotransferase [Tritonibacter multivorans]MDA7422257.1 sulfotransferase [Tritonibacter multivorans]CUH77806.1 Sulfotransferase domain protein [Tritonibacter multivorans]SFD11423.1 Sulfotransferase family protein [Tritonibacter multivorans]
MGSPRSGTKLLRSLLNRNSLVNLCDPESHFIPYLFQKHGGQPEHFEADLDALFIDFDQLPFQIYCQSQGRPVMTRRDFQHLEQARNWSDAFEVILRFYGEDAAAGEGPIWGDKTPSYVLEMDLLKRIFPAARFVHIVRDPRDVALSAKAAWGHNPLRTAVKWARDMAAAEQGAKALGRDYLRVFYEQLVADPETELRRVSTFIDRAFEAEMTTLSVPSENIGGARGKRFIDAKNIQKYRQTMPPTLQRRIEEITFPWITDHDTPYKAELARRYRPMSPLARKMLTGADGLRSILHKMRRKGMINGLRITIGNRLQKRRSPQ